MSAAEGPSFSHAYGPRILQSFGPILFADWDLPEMQRRTLTPEAALSVRRIEGGILLDTGATATCIASWVAEELGLVPIRIAEGFGAAGKHRNPVYLAQLTIPITGADGVLRTRTWQLEAQGIKDLDETPMHKHLTFMGNQVRFLGLLGRDVLSTARFFYDGVGGKVSFKFIDPT